MMNDASQKGAKAAGHNATADQGAATSPSASSPTPKKRPAPLDPLRGMERKLESTSPFELKNLLLSYAKHGAEKSSRTLLNAGRGNPNWICTLAREAFFTLGHFAMEEARRHVDITGFDIAGMPPTDGAAARFGAFLGSDQVSAFLRACVAYGVEAGIDADELVHEWTEGIVGCEYPVPERILTYAERLIGRYLNQELCGSGRPDGYFDLFATEGGTAAMCYLFYSLKSNFLLGQGDRIALATPIFTPYLEIPVLADFGLEVIHIGATTRDAEGRHTWQMPDRELDKLRDPAVKLLCLVNPSNPPSYAMDDASRAELVRIVKQANPSLMIITDDVYGTFVPGYRSILEDLPYNTASVYSFSKYFGATGWRLATIAIAKDNVFDDAIAGLSAGQKALLAERYTSLTDTPEQVRFIDRMVADSRLVALNGTAGLSTPQQVQMTLFALYGLLDAAGKLPARTDGGAETTGSQPRASAEATDVQKRALSESEGVQTRGAYKSKVTEIVEGRFDALWNALGFTIEKDPLRADYYSIIDIEIWAKKLYGDDFLQWLRAHFDPLDIVIRLAKETGVIVLNGDGFDASRWSVRVSLANLVQDDYVQVGKRIVEILEGYHALYRKSLAP